MGALISWDGRHDACSWFRADRSDRPDLKHTKVTRLTMNAFRQTPHDPKPPSAVTDVRARIAENAFLSDTTLEMWARVGLVVRGGGSIAARDGTRYSLRDAVRILGRRNGEADPYGLTGRVESLRDLIRQGASIANDGVRFGPCAYDVEFGFVALAQPSADESGANPIVR